MRRNKGYLSKKDYRWENGDVGENILMEKGCVRGNVQMERGCECAARVLGQGSPSLGPVTV